MKVLVAFFSYTGNTRRVAERLAAALREKACVELEEIKPTRHYPYQCWLTLSFIPNLRTPVKPPKRDPTQYDVVCLGLPKWTFSCPPVNQYLKEVNLKGKTMGVFVTYGGFDQRRYMKQIVRQLSRRGAQVKATLLVKRSCIVGEECKVGEYVRRFSDSLLGPS